MTSHTTPVLTSQQSPQNILSTPRRPELPALTGIRFLAAMHVVFFHFGAGFAMRHHASIFVLNFLQNGWTAVTLFFILSGFILSYTYSGQIEGHRNRARFWQARFARIYPVYLLSLLLMLPFSGQLSPGLSVAVLTMVQGWNPLHPEYRGMWNMPAWTLSVEAFFYLVFPFLLPLFARASTRTLRILLLAVIALIVFAHTMDERIAIALSRSLYLPMPLIRLPEFLAGMLAGTLFLRRSAPVLSPASSSMLGSASIVFILVIDATIRGPWISLLAIPFTILLYLLAMNQGFIAGILGSKAAVLLGGASYAVYLLQQPVRFWMHLALDRHKAMGGIDAFLSPFVLVIFSILVFLYWEEPVRRWLKKRFANP